MQTQRFRVIRNEVRKINDLKRSTLNTMIENTAVHEYHLRLSEYFEHFHRDIVIDEQNRVHSDYNEIELLINAGVDEVNVVIIVGIQDEVDAAKLSDHSTLNSRKHFKDLAVLNEYYTSLLKSTDKGREWAKEIPGDRTRDKISFLLNTCTGHLGMLKVLKQNAPELLVNDSETLLNSLYHQITSGNTTKIRNDDRSNTEPENEHDDDIDRSILPDDNINPPTEEDPDVNSGIILTPSNETPPILGALTIRLEDESFQLEQISASRVRIIPTNGDEYEADITTSVEHVQSGDVEYRYDIRLLSENFISITYIKPAKK